MSAGAGAGAVRPRPLVVIDAIPRGLNLGLRELWARREVVYFLTWRNIKVRYRQTYVGVAWAILQPLLSMLIFTVIFSRWAGIRMADRPYPLAAYIGLLPWTFVTGGVVYMSYSLVAQATLIRKIYLPRLALPVAALGTYLVDFGLALLVLVPLMIRFGAVPGPWIVFLPVFVGIAMALALGLGAWAAAVEVRYRDVSNVLRFAIQLWFYASPVIYGRQSVPEEWRLLYDLNPMVGVIEGLRLALLGPSPDFSLGTPWRAMVWSAVAAAVILYLGLRRFRQAESTFADVI